MIVDVFVARVPAHALAWLAGRLDDRERERAARFLHAADRQAYVAAHGVLRLALDYAAGQPCAWTFGVGDFGKPRLLDPPVTLFFNLSHNRQWVAVAVSRQCEVGVDIETLDRSQDLADLDQAWLSGRERQFLAHAPLTPASVSGSEAGAVCDHGLQRLIWWVGKEALVKAVGCGLHQPLTALTLPPGYDPGVWQQAVQLPSVFGPQGPAAWPWYIEHTPEFCLALAMHCPPRSRHDASEGWPAVRLHHVLLGPQEAILPAEFL